MSSLPKASLWEMAVDAWLERAAARTPAAIAVETPAGACCYAELLEGARAGAGALAARGVGRGERVAIALPAGLDFVYALHACLLLGAVAVPVDLRLGERERAAIVDRAAVVVDESLRAGAAPNRPPAPHRTCPPVPSTTSTRWRR